MNDSKFLNWLEESPRPVLGDGAMGTMLHQAGVAIDQCFDALNLNAPSIVAEIHRQYLHQSRRCRSGTERHHG